MYEVSLFLHSLVRWLVLGTGIAALVLAIRARATGAAYTERQRSLGLGYVSSLHLNLLLGFLLYFVLSPLTLSAFSDPGAAMKSSLQRFFFVEHVFGMLLGVVLATIGSAKVKRAPDDRTKHQRTSLYVGLSLLCILLSIPWPFYPAGRPLFWLPF